MTARLHTLPAKLRALKPGETAWFPDRRATGKATFMERSVQALVTKPAYADLRVTTRRCLVVYPEVPEAAHMLAVTRLP